MFGPLADRGHNFQMFVGYTPLAERAVEEVAAFVRLRAGEARQSGDECVGDGPL
jgi:hypothetical protein